MIMTLALRYWWAIALAVMTLAVTVQTKRLDSSQRERAAIQARFDVFVEQTKALGDAQIAENRKKEAEDAKTIRSAVTARDVALNSLRHALSSASGRPASLTPPAPAGSSQICLDPPAFAAAVERYRGRVRGLVGEGDAASIDAKALIDAWPK